MPPPFDLVVRGGTLVSSAGQALGDVGITGGKIEAVGDLSGATSIELLDASGLHVFPGAIDTQVHFREPGLTHKEDIAHGSAAAVMGGVTTYFEMPNTDPPTITASALSEKLSIAQKTSWANYGFFVGASKSNVYELATLENMPGTPGVKIFAGSSTGPLLVDDEDTLRNVLKSVRRPCPVHSEDEARLRERKKLLSSTPNVSEHPFLRDAEAASICTERMIRLCRQTGRPIHILHVSTLDEIPLLQAAKREGHPVTCEVTPQHLTFCAGDYASLGTRIQMNPPIRSREHREALWDAVGDGLFDVFGSDHAPHTLEEKAKPYPQSPSGMPGVQTMLPVLLDFCSQGRLNIRTLVKMACENPAKLYGIKNKGEIVQGYDADLAIFDLEAKLTIDRSWLKSKCGWSPFAGRTLTGRPIHTIVMGSWSVRDSALIGNPAGQEAQYTWK